MFRLLPALTGTCPSCEADWPEEDGLCADCRVRLFTPIELPGLIALGYYRGNLRRTVRAFKFAGNRRLARPLGRAVAAQVAAAGWKIDCVAYVPVSRRGRRERGFDQARELAEVVRRELGKPLLHLLNRKESGSKQSRLDPLQRIANAYQSYAPARAYAPARVLLIDDVYTTGATASACRDALVSIGASKVLLAVVALAPKRSPLALMAGQGDDGKDGNRA